MKKSDLLALLCFAATGLTTQAQSDPLQEHLVPPHVIIEHGVGAQLEDSQRQAVQSAVQRMHLAIEETNTELEEAIESLRDTLQEKALNEEKALSNLEDVLTAERVVKQNHLRMLIRANKALNPQQRKALLAAWHKQRTQKQAGKNQGPGQGMPPRSRRPEDADEKKRPEPPTSWISEKDLKSQISEMRVEEVAWRTIAWKTCLLDGLNASRKEKKPVILWVFIDRPVDDKRC